MCVAVVGWLCLMACVQEQRPLRISSTPLATEPVPSSVIVTRSSVPLATSGPAARFTYEGVTITYANGLVHRLTTAHVAAQTITGFSQARSPNYYFGVPDFLVFNFETEDDTLPSRLVIQRLRDERGQFYVTYPAAEIDYFNQLTTRLESFVPNEPLTRQLDFANGTGVRSVGYLPIFADTEPLSDAQIFYLFEGLTTDGRYYIWLQFNLQTPILPDEPGPFSQDEQKALAAGIVEHQTYLRQQLALVMALPATAFTPNLSLLDDLVQSLYVPPEASAVSSLPENKPGCENAAVYISENIRPNSTQVEPEQLFIKTWRLQNTGSCTWSAAYQLVSDNHAFGLESKLLIPVVPAGETADITISLLAPSAPGFYEEEWQLQSPSMPDQTPAPERFGPMLSVVIEVVTPQP